MRGLSLRSRLLLGLGLVALVQVVAAIVVISVTSEELLEQIDDRLSAIADSEPTIGVDLGNASAVVDGTSDLYQGILSPDGELTTVNAVANRGVVVPPPAVVVREISIGDQAITVEAQSGEVEYRLVAFEAQTGETIVLASPLRGYEWTINRLTRLVAILAAAMMMVLGAVAWWVLRLGITPIKQMTASAEAIADGDLSERIDDTDPTTEAGQLGLALNTMMGKIETSFDKQARAEERLRQFIADASHELRTPVATIRGYAELYEAGGLKDPEQLDDALQRTRQESERMSRLIADLLRLANLDAERAMRSDRVDVAKLASEVVSDAAATHPSHAIAIEVPEKAVFVVGDEDLIRQVLVNVVSNAAVHTPGGTTTTVAISSDDHNAMIVVADNGDGMSADVVARATERFFRGDPSRSRKRGGSGLGLAIADGIVEAHSGDLQITSSVGHGTTVTVTLPVAPYS